MDVQVANGVVDIAVEDEAEAVAVDEAVPVVLPGPAADVGVRRPAPTAPRHPREPAARLRRAPGDRDARRRRQRARAAPRLRPRHGDVADPHRGPADRPDRQQPGATCRVRSTATAPTRRPASCSCATRSTSRSSSCATRPGMMVGPEIEKTALVRHCNRLFVVGANLSVPMVMIVLRKGYGLGAQAMAGGSFKEPFAVGAWPTAEFGGMGLEGQVKLGFRNELAAMDDPRRPRAPATTSWWRPPTSGARRIQAGVSFQVDDVIDPADSRHFVAQRVRLRPAAAASRGQEATVRRRVVIAGRPRGSADATLGSWAPGTEPPEQRAEEALDASSNDAGLGPRPAVRIASSATRGRRGRCAARAEVRARARR